VPHRVPDYAVGVVGRVGRPDRRPHAYPHARADGSAVAHTHAAALSDADRGYALAEPGADGAPPHGPADGAPDPDAHAHAHNRAEPRSKPAPHPVPEPSPYPGANYSADGCGAAADPGALQLPHRAPLGGSNERADLEADGAADGAAHLGADVQRRAGCAHAGQRLQRVGRRARCLEDDHRTHPYPHHETDADADGDADALSDADAQ
jgi:hypothetical protein